MSKRIKYFLIFHSHFKFLSKLKNMNMSEVSHSGNLYFWSLFLVSGVPSKGGLELNKEKARVS